MVEEVKKINYIKKDLLGVLIVMLIIFIFLGLIIYFDMTQHIIGKWSTVAYNFILQR